MVSGEYYSNFRKTGMCPVTLSPVLNCGKCEIAYYVKCHFLVLHLFKVFFPPQTALCTTISCQTCFACIHIYVFVCERLCVYIVQHVCVTLILPPPDAAWG